MFTLSIETEGLLKVTVINPVKVVISQKQCKIGTLLLRTLWNSAISYYVARPHL